MKKGDPSAKYGCFSSYKSDYFNYLIISFLSCSVFICLMFFSSLQQFFDFSYIYLHLSSPSFFYFSTSLSISAKCSNLINISYILLLQARLCSCFLVFYQMKTILLIIEPSLYNLIHFFYILAVLIVVKFIADSFD